ncbi:oleosin H2-like [Nicotiana tabacum]|uniref:Oleosin n=1 Tax=Nicotiana tabacum TaxID=4097 RepID=A0A1S3X3X4_TOBAC|nr:oleosin 18.2 kDa-like [Nicotiana tomentosiformis]XP_016434690.1 PREDICTED: oleosin 18.2 kDa-like [Nicotiana tabacum]
MGDRHAHGQIQTHQYPHQIQVHPHRTTHEAGGMIKSLLPQRGPSATQVLAIVTLLPVGGTLFCLAGITLFGSLIGLAVATPVFLLFSPVLVPAILTFALAVAGFLTSGAFGVTGLSSLSWILNYFRQGKFVPENLDAVKRRMQDAAVQLGQKTKDAGQTIQNKAREGKEGARTT